MLKQALVIDDDPCILALITEMLSSHGYVCAGASNAEEALSFGHELKNMDVIFTDIKMPKTDGFELIQAFKDKGLECPIIAVTGLPDKGENLFMKDDGKRRARPDMTFTKPFGMKNVEEILELVSLRSLAKNGSAEMMQMDLGL